MSDPRVAHRPSRGWGRTGALALVAVVVLVSLAAGRELTPPDEPRFALVAREMYEHPVIGVRTLGGEPYRDKPPLLFWAAALAFRLGGGASETAARIPSVLAATALVVWLHRAARRRHGEPVATNAAAALLAMQLFVQRGAWIATDALLAAAVFAAVTSSEAGRSAASPAGRKRAGWTAGAAAGVGVLAKGPVALVLVGLAELAHRLARGGQEPPTRPSVWRCSPAWVALAVVVAPWLAVDVAAQGVGPLAAALVRHNAGRFLASWDNLEPWWYHLPALAVGTLPLGLAAGAVLAAPSAVIAALKDCAGARWLAWWIGLGLIFFSIPAGKRSVYLLPLYPALAWLVALLVAGMRPSRSARAAAAIGLGGGGVVLLGAGIAFALDPGGRLVPDAGAGPAAIRPGLVAACLAVGLALLGSGVAIAWRGRRGLPAVAAWPLLLAVVAPVWVTPSVDAALSGRATGAAIRRAVPDGWPVGFLREKWELAAFYADLDGRLLRSERRVAKYLEREGPKAVVGPLDRLGPLAGSRPAARIVRCGRFGQREMGVVLIGGTEPRLSSPVSGSTPPGGTHPPRER